MEAIEGASPWGCHRVGAHQLCLSRMVLLWSKPLRIGFWKPGLNEPIEDAAPAREVSQSVRAASVSPPPHIRSRYSPMVESEHTSPPSRQSSPVATSLAWSAPSDMGDASHSPTLDPRRSTPHGPYNSSMPPSLINVYYNGVLEADHSPVMDSRTTILHNPLPSPRPASLTSAGSDGVHGGSHSPVADTRGTNLPNALNSPMPESLQSARARRMAHRRFLDRISGPLGMNVFD